MSHFLTILTRVHPGRPECLKRNIANVKGQTFNDIQHLLLKPKVEPTGTGRERAAAVGYLIYGARNAVNGQYVMQLDDDDMIASPDFVQKIHDVVTADSSIDMIIFKCRLGDSVLPKPYLWNRRILRVSEIAGPNILVRWDVYQKAAREWTVPIYESDFLYIEECARVAKNIKWLNIIGTCSQGQAKNNVGNGDDEIAVRGELCAK
jgi:hypothetical protein